MYKYKLNILITTFILTIILNKLWGLFSLKRTFVWDPSVWYGIYFYFANGIYNNFLSLWNPYMNGGEPYWPVFGLFRLIDPLNLFFILIGKLFDIEIFNLYHIQFIIKYLIVCIGVFLVLFQLYKNYLLSLAISCIFLLSCFTVNLWDGVYMAFCWVPFILLFIIKFIESNYKIINLTFSILFTGIFLGASYYHFIYAAFIAYFFIIVYFIPQAIINKKIVILYIKNNIQIIISLISLLFLMSIPMFYTFAEYIRELHPIARTAIQRELFDSDITKYFSYEFTMSNFKYFFTPTQTLDSILYFPFAGSDIKLQNYFSIFILIITLFGFIKNRSKFKIPTIFIFILLLFLIVGSITPVHKFICFLFPPLFITRHTHIFVIFEYLIICIYLGYGIIHFSRYFTNNTFLSLKMISIYILCACIYFFHSGLLMKQTQDINAYMPTFKHGSIKPEFNNNREFAMGRTAYYVYEPILYDRNVALQMLVDPPQNITREDYPLFKEWALNTLRPDDLANNLGGPSYGYRTIYWLKDYLFNYKLTELDPTKFKLLMQVDQPLIFFNSQYYVITKDMERDLFTNYSAEIIKVIFKNYSIIINEKINSTENKKWEDFILNNKFELNVKNNSDFEFFNYSPGSISIKLKNIDKQGILQYSDMNAIGWRVYVDGKEMPLLTMAGGFKGVNINTGNRLVEFKYVPRVYIYSFYLYLIISLVIFPLLILILKYNILSYKFKISIIRR